MVCSRSTLGLMALAFTLLGCTTMGPSRLLQKDFVPLSAQQQEVVVPALNEVSVSQVGDAMVIGGNLYTRPAISLLEAVTHEGVSRAPYIIHLPAGIYFASGQSLKPPIPGTFYQGQQPLRFQSGADAVVKGGVFVPDREGMNPYIYWHATDTGVPLVDPEPVIRYEKTTHEEWKADSFRQELVYNGRTGDTIKLLYREYMDNMARPAFTQEVTYDLEQGETIGFKGARFKVHEASNVEIRYTVLAHFASMR